MIQAQNIVKTFKNGSVETQVLKGVSVTITDGEFVAIMGKSGAGKSTLINILTTYLDYNSGEIKISGKDLRKEYYEIRKK